MGLIKETNAAYYSGQIIQQATSDNQQLFEFGNTATGVGFNTNLILYSIVYDFISYIYKKFMNLILLSKI